MGKGIFTPNFESEFTRLEKENLLPINRQQVFGET
jgi:hypothetical protein